MTGSQILIYFFILSISIYCFSLWAGGRVREKYNAATNGKTSKFEKKYYAYKKGDPYRFIYRLFIPTTLIIGDSHLYLVCSGRFSSFYMHISGVLNIINLSNLSVSKVNETTLEISFEDEGGFKQDLRLSGHENELIFELLSAKTEHT